MVGPRVAQLAEDQLEYLKVVVLLVAHDVDHLVEFLLAEAGQRGAQVLRHVDRRAVASQQQFLVEPVGSQIAPHRSVVATVEHAFGEALLDDRFAEQIGLRLVVYLIEADAHRLVGLVEALVDPAVHHFPKRVHLRVLGFPPAEHLLRLAHDRRLALGLLLAHAGGRELFHLGLVGLVESDVVIAYEVIALLARRGGRLAPAELLPCEHRLADVNTPVVHEVDLDDAVAGRFEYQRHGVAEQVVAHVPQMQRLVRVRRGVLDHDRATVGCTAAVAGRTEDFVQPFGPEAGRERNVQEAFDHVVAADFRYRADQSAADLLGRSLGTLAAELEQREDDEGHVALELLAGLLYLDRGAAGVAVKRLDAAGNVLLDELLDVHGCLTGICSVSGLLYSEQM